MALLYVVLRDFTFVYLLLLRQEVRSKLLLEQSRAFVLLVLQDAVNRILILQNSWMENPIMKWSSSKKSSKTDSA